MKRIVAAFAILVVVLTSMSIAPKSAQAGGGDDTVNGLGRRACPLSVGWCEVSINEAVVGARVNINGVERDGCFVDVMPSSGWIMAGVINPWPGEVSVEACSAFTTSTQTTNGVRQATGKGATLPFKAGDSVIGFAVKLDNGQNIPSGCFLSNAPSNGTVTDGVINPDQQEIASATLCIITVNGLQERGSSGFWTRLNQGEAAFGDIILLDNGALCVAGNCFDQMASSGGWVLGWVNPQVSRVPFPGVNWIN